MKLHLSLDIGLHILQLSFKLGVCVEEPRLETKCKLTPPGLVSFNVPQVRTKRVRHADHLTCLSISCSLVLLGLVQRKCSTSCHLCCLRSHIHHILQSFCHPWMALSESPQQRSPQGPSRSPSAWTGRELRRAKTFSTSYECEISATPVPRLSHKVNSYGSRRDAAQRPPVTRNKQPIIVSAPLPCFFFLDHKRLYNVLSSSVLEHAMHWLFHQQPNLFGGLNWPKGSPMVHFSICASHPSEVTS